MAGLSDAGVPACLDFYGDCKVMLNLESESIIQATLNSAYDTEESAKAKENREFVQLIE